MLPFLVQVNRHGDGRKNTDDYDDDKKLESVNPREPRPSRFRTRHETSGSRTNPLPIRISLLGADGQRTQQNTGWAWETSAADAPSESWDPGYPVMEAPGMAGARDAITHNVSHRETPASSH